MRVLVTYGSKRGGTEGIARILGEALQREGLEVEVKPANEAGDPAAYNAVIVGGALYMMRWHRDARRFITRHAATLRQMPVWIFSSGPLDDSAKRGDIPPIRQVRSLMARVGARGHATFGGRLEKDARGFIAWSMAEKNAGDWRDTEQIERWGQEVGQAILESPARLPVKPWLEAPLRAALVVLCLFVGVTAMGGGLALIAGPDGTIVNMPLSELQHGPFRNFLVPGWLLFGVVGLLNTLAGLLVLRRYAVGNTAAFISGGAIAIWIVVEMMLVYSSHWLQVLYLGVGLAIQALALLRARALRPPGTREPSRGRTHPHQGPVLHTP